MYKFLCFVVAASLFLHQICYGQSCPFDVMSDADQLTVTCTPVTGLTDTWDLHVEVVHSAASADVEIIVNKTSSGNRPSISNLTFALERQGGGSQSLSINLSVLGPQGDLDNLHHLGSLRLFSCSGFLTCPIFITELYTHGNVGYIQCHGMDFGYIGGNLEELYFDIYQFQQGTSLGSLEVGGNITGAIRTTPWQTLHHIVVAGDIGSETHHALIGDDAANPWPDINIGTIECQNMYAKILIGGTLRRVDIAGEFGGIVRAGKMLAVQGLGVGDPGFFIDSVNVSADVAVITSFDAVIEINGDLLPVSQLLLPEIPTEAGVRVEGDLACTFEIASDVAGFIEVSGTIEDTSVMVGRDITSSGSAIVGNLDCPIDIVRDLAGTVEVENRFIRPLIVGEEFSGDIIVRDESGLVGQIVINGAATSTPNLWSGEVSFGPSTPVIVLGPGESQPYKAPYYHILSSELGGGAIGLVPYQFHEKESSPEHDSVVSSAVPTSVTIHHYGPLLDDGNGGTTPVRIFRAGMALPLGFTHHREVPLCYGSVWTEVTSGFDISISGREVHIANDAASFQKGYAYQFIAEGILCGLAAGTPSTFYREDWAWEGAWDEGEDDWCCGLPKSRGYGFIIPTGMDLNFNLMHDTGDLELWLLDPVDVNDDDVIDFLDAAAIIDAIAEQE
ncbi:MAG: hypothetical protein KF757_04760 [Phycisphaeraceae bacterium]|nr:hypothetical protein [Phycisphaeraceae bacterium]MCW5763919.1 hypothetical protein [Phycisphaeraceae bacterium]